MSDETVYIRNDILRLVYLGMLLKLPLKDVRVFWKRNAIPGIDPQRDEADIYRFLWNEKHTAPLEYVFNTLSALQKYLMQKEVCPFDFLKDSLQVVNLGIPVGPKTLLLWVQPFLENFFSEKDLRTMSLHLIPMISQNVSPAIFHEMVSFSSDEDYNIASMMIMRASPSASSSDHEKTYAGRLPSYDVELWTGMMTQISPFAMNLPPFEDLSMVCDTRGIPEIQELIKGFCPGASRQERQSAAETTRLVSFHEFCTQRGINLDKYKIPDCTVHVAGETVSCPLQKRTMIYQECAYGAPVGIYKLRYKKILDKPDRFLSNIFKDALGENNQMAVFLERRHGQMLESTAFTARFVYNAEHSSLSVNGRHLVKFVPAKMLRKILKAYTESGRCDFSYRDFSYDSEIVNDHKVSNMNVRFNRLSELLTEEFPFVGLVKSGAGKITLHASCTIEYEEE